MKCYMCQEPHPIYRCPDFIKMNVENRIKKISELKVCKNCFRTNHTVDQCKARKCNQCDRSHNSLLHRNNTKMGKNIQINKEDNASDNIPIDIIEGRGNDKETELSSIANAMSFTSVYTERAKNNKQVLLATAIIQILGKDGIWYTCRALLDSGSQSNFITEETMKKFNLPRKRVNLPITGVAES